MNTRGRILKLLDKYAHQTCTDLELDELFGHLSSPRYSDLLDEHIMKSLRTKDARADGPKLEAYASEKIIRKIFSAHQDSAALIRRISMKRKLTRLAVAAVLIALVASVTLLIVKERRPPAAVQTGTLQQQSRRINNSSNKAMQVQLEDGSRITLQPTASLTYPNHFNGDTREVVLEGDAFFDIAKDPAKPFLVYHEKLVTKVLGTSFYIRYDKDSREVKVEVSTGKVAVFENPAYTTPDREEMHHRSNGIILIQNQKMLYAEDKHIFSPMLVDNPQPVLQTDPATGAVLPDTTHFRFEKAPLSQIVLLIQKSYNIDIDLENQEMAGCLFSGDISDQDLYAKLDILCEAIGISYEIKGTRILIRAKGSK